MEEDKFKEFIKQYIKDNVKLETVLNENTMKVRLMLENECISEDVINIPVKYIQSNNHDIL